MKISYFFLIPLALMSGYSQTASAQALYVSRDFTAENQFSGNIEGPSFDKSGNLYVVNFKQDGTVGKIDQNGQGEVFVTLPNQSIANAIQFNSRGEMLLADFVNHNVLKVNMQTKEVSVFAHDDRFNQPNDICITKKDVIYASDPSWKDNTGKLWKVMPDGKTTLLLDNLGTTNGIALSPDEKTLYVNESAQRKIWKYALDAQGNVKNKTLFHEFSDFGMDGMKCDAQGNLYCTRHGKGTIAVISPSGKLIREIPLKGKSCSNLVFGGEDKKTVYVTMQDRRGMEQFRVETPGK